MAGDDGKLTVTQDGTVEVDVDAKRWLARRPGAYRPMPGPAQLLCLARDPLQDGAEVAMAGCFGDALGVADLAGVVAQLGLRGELTIADGRLARYFSVEQGALRAVATEVPSERLGALLVHAGLLSPTDLEACLSDLHGQTRLGELALRRGLVGEQELFALLRRQASLAFQNALMLPCGHYTFVTAPDDHALSAPFTVHIPLQALLMESMQRIDEMQVFRERIPSGEMRPYRRPGAERLGMTDLLRPVAALADGQNSVHDIGRLLQLDEYETTRRVYRLMQLGALSLESADPEHDEALRALVDRFNGALSMIAAALAEHADEATAPVDLGAALARSLRDASNASLLETALNASGQLSDDVVMVRLAELPRERRQNALWEALHDLTSFALFTAGHVLPRPAETALNQRVQRMLRG